MKKIIFIILLSIIPTAISAQAGFPRPLDEKPEGKKLELINTFIKETHYQARLKSFLSISLSAYSDQYSHDEAKKIYDQFNPDEFLKDNQAFYAMFKHLSLEDINKIINLYRSLEGGVSSVPMISDSLIGQLNDYAKRELKKLNK
ncbi:hypothetical protein [Chryseobacterium indologenes]|uniref:DUF2059 domain-containing protein n=1 Tax=Chryseobacterium indologenes TaxID=253 RepID=A0A0N0ZYG7_CHRID|nr:hypothetical protein [Chryseobacterium indologenes]KPE51537.1 hypothetical protein AOB46_07640 [Chryseobacterium indologenes]